MGFLCWISTASITLIHLRINTLPHKDASFLSSDGMCSPMDMYGNFPGDPAGKTRGEL